MHIGINWGFVFVDCDLSRLDHFVLICKPDEHSNTYVMHVEVDFIVSIFNLETEALKV